MRGTLIHYIKQHNHFLKLSFDCFITFNVFSITCCIDMDSFSATSKAVILVAIYIVLCLKNKTFVGRVEKHFGAAICCGKSTKNLAVLLRLSLAVCLTYFPDTVLLSTVLKRFQVLFITLF